MTKPNFSAPCTSGLLALLIAGSLVISPQQLLSQTLISPAFNTGVNKKKKKADPPEVQLTITAAESPDPLLRYRLWPAVEKRRNISVNDIVSRAIIHTIQASKSDSTYSPQKFVEWESLPLDEMPIEDAKKAIRPYGLALAELKRGETLMRNDYDIQLDDLSPRELIGTLLPELQQGRLLSRVLCLRARISAAEHRWEDMIDDCRLGFRLAEITGKSTDFLVSRLVGQSIAQVTMRVLEDAITQADPPNLYWALASVPAENLFEIRESLEYGSVPFSRILKDVSNLPDTSIGEDQARAKLLELIKILTEMSETSLISAALSAALDSDTQQLAAGTFVIAIAEQSRDTLADTDQWRDRVDDLSDSEAVLRATVLEVKRMRDTYLAWSLLPDYLWDSYSKERNAIFDESGDSFNPATMLVLQLPPAVGAAKKAGMCSMQQYNFLLTLEALRMHAAETDQLPETIDGLRPVPARRDSLSQKNFGYQRTNPHSATMTRQPRHERDTETTFEIKLKGKP